MTTTEAPKNDIKATTNDDELWLLHPQLHQLPTPLRFLISGVLGNFCFVLSYNWAFRVFRSMTSAARIFAGVQFGCIILNHLLNISIVFGWPDDYWSSLASNMPVGLISLALGSFCTGFLDQREFDRRVQEWLVGNSNNDSGGSFYTSIVVMTITGVFNYVALNIVNAKKGKKKDDQKEKEL